MRPLAWVRVAVACVLGSALVASSGAARGSYLGPGMPQDTCTSWGVWSGSGSGGELVLDCGEGSCEDEGEDCSSSNSGFDPELGNYSFCTCGQGAEEPCCHIVMTWHTGPGGSPVHDGAAPMGDCETAVCTQGGDCEKFRQIPPPGGMDVFWDAACRPTPLQER